MVLMHRAKGNHAIIYKYSTNLNPNKDGKLQNSNKIHYSPLDKSKPNNCIHNL